MKNGKMVKVNFAESTIEMTPTFANAAGKSDSAEYKQLVGIQKDFPVFKIVVVAPKKKSANRIKGLTMKYMENYIKAHDDSDYTTMKEFAKLRGMLVNEKGELEVNPASELKVLMSYGEIKLWFMERYHEVFEDYDKEAKKIIEHTKEARAKRLAS